LFSLTTRLDFPFGTATQREDRLTNDLLNNHQQSNQTIHCQTIQAIVLAGEEGDNL
jgi:hypothetical protein